MLTFLGWKLVWGIEVKDDSLGNLAWSVRLSRDFGRRTVLWTTLTLLKQGKRKSGCEVWLRMSPSYSLLWE